MSQPSDAAGNAPIVVLFWAGAALLFFGPFLRDPSGLDPEGDDPGRLLSETDIPFAEDVANFEEEHQLGLGAAIAGESGARFELGSQRLLETGLFDVERVIAGRSAYERHCIGCHGSSGDGAGPAARHLSPRPRNFRGGVFKFTSTATGSSPLPRDLFQTVTRGLSGASMPGYRLLSEELRWDLVEYVRYLAVRGSFEQLMLDLAWEEEEIPDADEVAGIVLERWRPADLKAVYPPVPELDRSAETVARGRELFTDTGGANCAACHGPEGRGDGPSAAEFEDAWGYTIVPRDLTRGVFRAGSEPADLYRSISTGINGTPMPSYAASFSPEDLWSLVHFVQSLREE